MRSLYLLIVFAMVAAFGCSKKNKPVGKDEYVTLSYKQTFCADPWPTASSDSLTLVNVANYLNTNGLYIAGLSIKNESNPELCLACVCKTGKVIYVSTLNSTNLTEKYVQIGFK